MHSSDSAASLPGAQSNILVQWAVQLRVRLEGVRIPVLMKSPPVSLREAFRLGGKFLSTATCGPHGESHTIRSAVTVITAPRSRGCSLHTRTGVLRFCWLPSVNSNSNSSSSCHWLRATVQAAQLGHGACGRVVDTADKLPSWATAAKNCGPRGLRRQNAEEGGDEDADQDEDQDDDDDDDEPLMMVTRTTLMMMMMDRC